VGFELCSVATWARGHYQEAPKSAHYDTEQYNRGGRPLSGKPLEDRPVTPEGTPELILKDRQF